MTKPSAKAAYPFVSVIIPTHNRRKLLSDLLYSLEQQSYPPECFDVNIIHNYTDDGTEEFISEQIARSPFKISYTKKFNRTPTPSRHHGGMHAKGELIAFIDDDCIATHDWLQKGVEAFNNEDESIDPKIGIVQGKTMPNPSHQRRFLEKTVDIPEQTLFFETCNIFYSKRAFAEVGGFSEEFMDRFYGEDTDLGWKVEKAGYLVKFASAAIVEHHVFHVSVWKWLKEPLFFTHLPYLVKKYPEFRQQFFAKYFLTIETAMFQLFVCGIILGFPFGPWMYALCIPYFIQRYLSGNAMPNPLIRLVRIAAGLPRSCLTWYALVIGSIKYRSVLL